MLETLFSNLFASALFYQTQFVITFIRTLMMKSICELYVICGMYVESCMILVVVNRLLRPVVVLDGLPGLYGFKYDSVTACGMPLYLYSYKLVGSTTTEDHAIRVLDLPVRVGCAMAAHSTWMWWSS